ncbi:MAG: hypothetical protein V8R80_04070 [Eubacterium sp.]
MLDAKSVTAETIADGAVFIDYLSGSTAEIGTYETYGRRTRYIWKAVKQLHSTSVQSVEARVKCM